MLMRGSNLLWIVTLLVGLHEWETRQPNTSFADIPWQDPRSAKTPTPKPAENKQLDHHDGDEQYASNGVRSLPTLDNAAIGSLDGGFCQSYWGGWTGFKESRLAWDDERCTAQNAQMPPC
ncbi:hypothetical protein E4U53_000678 [Claviceps sorghi]|nr:hypothetical protein E4U53_000678 [Claviceps sorghi]